jgi:hypothetical protein
MFRPHLLKFTARPVPHPTRSTQRLTPGKSAAISPSDTIIFAVNDSSFPLLARWKSACNTTVLSLVTAVFSASLAAPVHLNVVLGSSAAVS